MGTEIELIDITEMNLNEAVEKLAENEMTIIISDSSYSPIIPKDFIINQLPKAFSTVKYGRRVYVTKSLGPQPISIPDLIGKSLKDASFQLEALGIGIKETLYAYSNKYPRNVVMNQSVEKDEKLIFGDSIRITVSKGLNLANIPVKNYVTLPYNVARKDAIRFGLIVIKEFTDESSGVLPGTIIRQSIKAGTLIKENMEIIFWVSR